MSRHVRHYRTRLSQWGRRQGSAIASVLIEKRPACIRRKASVSRHVLHVWTFAGAGHKADYIRALIAADFECKGIQWPNDLQQRGKYKRVRAK